MTEDDHSASGAALTELVLEIFRLNGRLLAAGDRLVIEVGLTSARWQVLGAIDLADEPQTVSGLAKSMGLTRQAVQRVVNEMESDGLVAFKTNPAHKRAQLVTLTRIGRAAYAKATGLQKPWVNDLARGLDRSKLSQARALLATIRERLEGEVE